MMMHRRLMAFWLCVVISAATAFAAPKSMTLHVDATELPRRLLHALYLSLHGTLLGAGAWRVAGCRWESAELASLPYAENTELCERYALDMQPDSVPGLIERFGLRFPGAD